MSWADDHAPEGYDGTQEMEAEGQILLEEETLDALVALADRLRARGIRKTDIHATLTTKHHTERINAAKWRQLVREAMGYL